MPRKKKEKPTDQQLSQQLDQAHAAAVEEAVKTNLPPDAKIADEDELKRQYRQEPPAEQSHAEAVAPAARPERKPAYNRQGVMDKIAGAELLEHHNPFLSVIRFEEKPSEAVRDMLHEAEFRWQPQNQEWTRPIRFETRQQDRLNAERVFEDITKIIRKEKGMTQSFGGAA